MTEDLNSYISENRKNAAQVVAFKEGKIAHNLCWNGFKETDNIHIASVTKSIMSLLIGIAIDEGLIKDVSQHILDFFSDYVIKRGEKTIQDVTIFNILTMTTPYKFKSEPWTKVCSSENWEKAVLDLTGGKTGIIGEFNYSTMGVYILSAIINKVSGLTTIEFANKYLFKPLEIDELKPIIINTKDEHIAFVLNKKPQIKGWFINPEGLSPAGFGLCLSALDLCKIGQLCLNKGIYNNKQIISSNWINEMTKPRTKKLEEFNNMSYGYLWWIIDEQSYNAIGDSGNFLYVNKEKNIVIAITSTFKPGIPGEIDFIKNDIEKNN